MKIFLGSLILPIKERKIKELSFGLAINQHNSGKNNSKQLATEAEAHHPARERWEPAVSQPEHQCDAATQDPGSRGTGRAEQLSLGSGGCDPGSAPRRLQQGRTSKRSRSKGVQVWLVCWIHILPLSVTDLRDARWSITSAQVPHPSTFVHHFPVSEEILSHSNADGRHWWNMWLYFSTCTVCLQCFFRVLGKDTALVLFCEALKQFSTIVWYLHCSFWSLDPPLQIWLMRNLNDDPYQPAVAGASVLKCLLYCCLRVLRCCSVSLH